jgi:hypothetical protein
MADEAQVVNGEPTTQLPSEGTKPTEAPNEVGAPVAPGSKTDSELLLKSLHEEKEKRRILEEKLRIAEEKTTSPFPEEQHSDEGKALKKEIEAVSAKLKEMEEAKELDGLQSQYPILREKAAEFETFKAEYPRTKLANVAKLFLAENDLLEPSRKGLEKTTGGNKTAAPSEGMTAEDVKILRETNPAKYRDMIMKDQLKIRS